MTLSGKKLSDFYIALRNRRQAFGTPLLDGFAQQIRKADDPVLTSTSNYRNTVYGAEVFNYFATEPAAGGWSALLDKEPWPEQDGIRIASAEPHSEAGVLENGTLPDTDKPDVSTFRIPVKIEATTWEQSLHAKLDRNDPVGGDTEAYLREFFTEWHAHIMNAQMGRDLETTGSATIELETIDRIISSSSEATNCLTNATAANPYGGGVAVAIRGGTGLDTTGDAVVSHNSNVDRVLTERLMADLLDDCLDNGGREEDYMWVTGRKTYSEIGRILGSKERYVDPMKVSVGFNGVQTIGVETGFMTASYQNIPVFRILKVPSDSIPRVYLVNRKHIKLTVAVPTLYATTDSFDDMILLDNLKSKSMYVTGAEVRAKRFDTSGKIRDLKAA